MAFSETKDYNKIMSNFKNLYEQLDRMTKLINYNDGSFNEEDYFVIYEGLLRSVSLNKAKVLIERLFSMYKLYWRDKIEMDEKNNTLLVDILDFQDSKDKIDYFLKYINNIGYFISIIYFKGPSETKLTDINYSKDTLIQKLNDYKNLSNLIVVLESSHDIEEDNIPDKLYHVTRQDVLHKIKKIGLVPRSESKKSTHPERIYLTKSYSDVYDMTHHFKKEAPDQKFAILEINTSKINHLRLFHDPNYRDYGYYILVNVPPNAIKILKENL